MANKEKNNWYSNEYDNQNTYDHESNVNNQYQTSYQENQINQFPKKVKIYRWEEENLYKDNLDFENSDFFKLLNSFQEEQLKKQHQNIEDNNSNKRILKR